MEKWKRESFITWKTLWYEITTCIKRSDGVTCLDISEDDKFVVSGSYDNNILLYNMDQYLNQKEWSTKNLFGHTQPVTNVKFFKNLIISSGRNGVIKIWDMKNTENCKFTLKHSGSPIPCIDINHDRILASGSTDGSIKTWNTLTGKRIRSIKAHSRGVEAVKYYNNLLISGGNDKKVKFWNKGKCLKTMDAGGHVVKIIAKNEKAYCCNSVGEIRIFDIQTTTELLKLSHIEDNLERKIYSICLSPTVNPSLIASGANDNLVNVWDLRTSKKIAKLQGHTATVFCLEILNCESLIVSGSQDGSIRVWDIRNLTKNLCWMASSDSCGISSVQCLTTSKYNSFLVAGGVGSKVHLFEVV